MEKSVDVKERLENAELEKDRLLKKYPNGKLIEFEDGQWAFFKKPTRQVVGLAMSKSRNNPLAMLDVLVANCLLDSSPGVDLKSDAGLGYLMGLADKMDDIIGTKKAEIKN